MDFRQFKVCKLWLWTMTEMGIFKKSSYQVTGLGIITDNSCIKYWSIYKLISLLILTVPQSTCSCLQTAGWELVRSINLLQSKRGKDTLSICLFCHAGRQEASLFAVHPLIYQMSTVGLVQSSHVTPAGSTEKKNNCGTLVFERQ